MDIHNAENSPYRYWPDGLTEPDIDALMAEAGIDIHEAPPDLIEAPEWDTTPRDSNGTSEPEPPAAAGNAAA